MNRKDRETYERCWNVIAHHEAGHVVACVLLGAPFDAVGVDVDMDGSEPVLLGNTPTGRDVRTDERDAHLVSLLAGLPAEREWYRQWGRRMRDVQHVLADNSAFDREDAAHLLPHTRYTMRQAEREADQLITSNWPRIHAVVVGLCSNDGYLTAQQCHEIVR